MRDFEEQLAVGPTGVDYVAVKLHSLLLRQRLSLRVRLYSGSIQAA
jgi:hypothetical protein